MAISTTSTVDDVFYSYLIEPMILSAASEHAQLSPLARQFDRTGPGSKGVQVAVAGSIFGTPNDFGAGVDTEYNAAEATDLTSTTFSTSAITAAASEYGVRIDVTDALLEDAVDAVELLNVIESSMAAAIALAIDDDMAALFASLSNTVGTSGADLTVAQFLSAFNGIRVRGNRAPDGLVAVVSNQQASDLEGALVASSTSMAVYTLAADRFLAAAPGPNNGLINGQVMQFRGYPVFASGLCDTANAGADDVGAVFVPSTTANDAFATYGLIMKREPRLETQRDASARSNELVLTARVAPFELRDNSGTAVITDAA